MANDRVYAVCERCGATEALTKYYPSTGAYLAITERNNFGRFFDAHIDCSSEGGSNIDLGPGVLLSLIGETEFCSRGGLIGGELKLKPLNPLGRK